ncbi:spore photoproduct lyase family protein [Clostridium sp. BJN0001]|uniref:SPL family radical SAM protein n=1 Tax=Clostridium sp. BJN0001 TaxID=2930219 RepID=UPI001FD41A2B|nr:radical SAM protein [Clostridium sp. BJN0001]
MKKLNKDIFNQYFSHIYIEKKALNHPNTKKILSYFKSSEKVIIDHYKDIFSRSHQDFYLQKQSPSLILAVKTDNIIYKGARFCDDFGNVYFYYTSSMKNCIYNCEYCYLQGMYPSADIVIFVNIEDIFNETSALLKKHPVYLCISYDTDILAFENVLHYARQWINFAKKNKALKIELRTKSANFNSIEDVPPSDNVILAWTLSPDTIAKNYESKTPSLNERLLSAKKAIDKGFNVRICFDPVLYLKNWQENYKNLIEKTFKVLPKDKIYDVSIGVFRVSSYYLKIMRKARFDSVILNYPFETKNKMCTYNKKLSTKMISYISYIVSKYIDKNKIYTDDFLNN